MTRTKDDIQADHASPLSPRSRLRWPQWLGPLAGLAVLVTIGGVANPLFLSPQNVLDILHTAAIVGVIALGMTFVIVLGGIDLSVGSLAALAGGVGIWMMNTAIHAGDILNGAGVSALNLMPPYSPIRTAIAAGISAIGLAGSQTGGVAIGFVTIFLVGTLAGGLNGLLITKGRVAPFVATLGGLAAYRSLALALADGGEFRSGSDAFKHLGTGGVQLPFLVDLYNTPVRLPWPVLIFAGAAIVMHVLLNHTRYGRHVLAIGCNERAAQYSAVRVDRVRLMTYTLIGSAVGLAAMMNSSRMNSVSSGMSGGMWELDAIAAVVIGGTRMTGGAGSIAGTIIGLLILGCITNILVLLQVSVHLQGLVKGLIIVAAVLIQRGRWRGER